MGEATRGKGYLSMFGHYVKITGDQFSDRLINLAKCIYA